MKEMIDTERLQEEVTRLHEYVSGRKLNFLEAKLILEAYLDWKRDKIRFGDKK